MNFLRKSYIYLSFLFALPFVASAQGDLQGTIGTVQNLLSLIPTIIITIAVITFMWGIIQYITAKDEAKQKEARSVMLYGIIVIVVMVSIWGIVALVQSTFNISGGSAQSGTNLVPNVRLE